MQSQILQDNINFCVIRIIIIVIFIIIIVAIIIIGVFLNILKISAYSKLNNN